MKYTGRCIVHVILWMFIAIIFLPIYLALVAASHETSAMVHPPVPHLPGNQLWINIKTVFCKGFSSTGGEPIGRMLFNSFVMAFCIAFGKVTLAITSAFALVYFNFPLKKICFALIFLTMMLPVEVRIVPTFQVVAYFDWLNSFSGLTLPLMVSATATFLFRQFFKSISNELVDAAKLDGASAFRFFMDIVLPLSSSQIAALFIIMFIYGWNQYLWPLIITSESSMATIVMGIKYLAGAADQVPQWNYIMTVAFVALLPPCLVVVILQRWFEQGLKE